MEDHIQNTIKKVIYNNSLDSELPISDILLLNALSLDSTVLMLRDIFDREKDMIVKSRAFNAILSIRQFDKVQFLIDTFDESSIDWQIVYCRSLSRFYDSRVITKLCSVLLANEDPDVRYVATEALAEIGDSSATETLEYIQKNDNGRDFEGFPIADVAHDALAKIKKRIKST